MYSVKMTKSEPRNVIKRKEVFQIRRTYRPEYWRWRRRLGELRFRWRRAGFGLRGRLIALGSDVRLISSVIREALWLLLGSVALVVIPELLVRVVGISFPGWLPLGRRVTGLEGFVAVVVTVGGTLLGLYFAAIGIVVSSVFAEAPDSLRTLFLRDRANQLYVRSISLLVLSGIVLLSLGLIDYKLHVVTLVLLALVGLFAVFSLLRAGRHAFNFFNPASLAYPLTRDFGVVIKRASKGGLRWRDPSFQAAYQRQAEEFLTTYHSLAEFILKRGPDESRLGQLANGLLVFWLDYSEQKAQIPTESHWFQRVLEHHDWLIADETAVSMALETGTGIAPKEIPDHLWVERHLVETVAILMDELLTQDDLRGAANIAERLSSILETLSSLTQVDEAFLLWRQLSESIWQCLGSRELGLETAPLPPQKSGALALADVCGTSLVRLLIGLASWSEQLNAESFRGYIDKSLRGNETIYAAKAPASLLRLFERLRQGLVFETIAEGSIVSPNWYLHHLPAREVIQFLDKSVEVILKEVEKEVHGQASKMMNREGGTLSSLLVRRGLEACSKMNAHLPEIDKVIGDVANLRRTSDEFWPQDKFGRHSVRVKGLEQQLIAILTDLIPILSSRPRDASVPDFFGHAYVVVHASAFEDLLAGRTDSFKSKFPKLFDAALTGFHRVQEALSSHDPRTTFVYSTEILIDLLELSGYALLMDELDSNGTWGTVKTTWDDWFGRHPKPADAIKYLHTVIEGRDSIFALMPRGGARAGRQMLIAQLLRGRGIVDEDYFPGRPETGPAHSSPIVRTFAPWEFGIMEEAEDLFYVEYLGMRPDAEGLELPGRSRSLAEKLARERSRGTTGSDGDYEGEGFELDGG